jgi:5'-nucleotidase
MSLLRSSRVRRPAIVAVAAAAAAALTIPLAGSADAHRTVELQLLAINDFHGNLEPPGGSGGRINIGTVTVGSSTVANAQVDAGGVEYLGTVLDRLRRGQENSITVAAGDLIGASPLLSAAFHDEPTIEAMNKVGLQVTSVGNHEFDEGWHELLRMQNGGCIDDGDGANNQNSCPAGEFQGANFQYLAANVVNTANNKTILPAVWTKRVGSVRVGFIGMTLEGTPEIVTQSGIAGLRFDDEVVTANKYAQELKRKGVNAIVVLIHEGGVQTGLYDECNGISGAIVDIAKNLDPSIDAVVSGHTHQAYVCDIPDPNGNSRLVTSGASFGRLVTEIKLSLDTRTRDVIRASVDGDNVIVDRRVKKDADLTALIAKYKALVGPIANKQIGFIGADITRTANAAGESALGDLIADAQKADTTVAGQGAIQAAFMNPGGIRADLPLGDGAVTYEEAFTVQPFNNYLVSMNMTGTQIDTMLEQQWLGTNATAPKILQVSNGFTYAWNPAVPNGTPSKVDIASIKINGQPIDPNGTYRIVTNNFVAEGGDGFVVFKDIPASAKLYGGLDIDAFANYLTANSSAASPYLPAPLNRITQTP